MTGEQVGRKDSSNPKSLDCRLPISHGLMQGLTQNRLASGFRVKRSGSTPREEQIKGFSPGAMISILNLQTSETLKRRLSCRRAVTPKERVRLEYSIWLAMLMNGPIRIPFHIQAAKVGLNLVRSFAAAASSRRKCTP